VSRGWSLAVALLYGAAFAALVWHYHRDPRNAAHLERPRAGASLQAFTWVYRWLQPVSAAALVDALVGPGWLPRLLVPGPALTAAGVAGSAAGLWLFVAAKRQLGLDYSPCDDARLPRDLVRLGAYRLVRHPIYAANLLLLGGACAASGSAVLAFNWLALLGCYLASMRLEERALLPHFPGYQAYRARTGALLPGLRALGELAGLGRRERG